MLNLQIQPDMITLNPEFVGSLAPPSKLTTAVNNTNDTPFARLPRLERLRIQGKADETEILESSGDEDQGPSGKKEGSVARKKRKLRGKGKSMKRFLRKQRKNVIDPTTVCYLCMTNCRQLIYSLGYRLLSAPNSKNSKKSVGLQGPLGVSLTRRRSPLRWIASK